MGRYVKKTTRRRREDRNLTVRAEHRDPPDADKLCQLLIRFTLQDFGESRVRGLSQKAEATSADPV